MLDGKRGNALTMRLVHHNCISTWGMFVCEIFHFLVLFSFFVMLRVDESCDMYSVPYWGSGITDNNDKSRMTKLNIQTKLGKLNFLIIQFGWDKH